MEDKERPQPETLMWNKMDKKAFSRLFSMEHVEEEEGGRKIGKLDEKGGEDSGTCSDNDQRSSQGGGGGSCQEEPTSDFSESELEPGPDSFLRFHLKEKKTSEEGDGNDLEARGLEETFAGSKVLGVKCSTIKSSRGSVRGVKNRVRAGIATFLQINTNRTWQEKEAGQLVVYTTTMGVIRETYQRCLKVLHILRTHLVKFTEKDVFMSREVQTEIRERMGTNDFQLPQVFVEGILLGDAEVIEKLNESGELRQILKPYQVILLTKEINLWKGYFGKRADAWMICRVCGGYRLLPCGICNGSKKSVHRNHFNAEHIALKCMNCDEVGLVRCYACST